MVKIVNDKAIMNAMSLLTSIVSEVENVGSRLEKDLKRISQESEFKLSLAELHVLHAIGTAENVNGTYLAREIGMTKSGISKVVGKLLQKSLIEAERFPDNRREVYYTLTETGGKYFTLHADLHGRINKRLYAAISVYRIDELELITRFMQDVLLTVKSAEHSV